MSTESAAPPPTGSATENVSGRFVAPWAQGDKLRNIEKEALIPKMMKKRSMKVCKEFSDVFTECAKGRTITALWYCRQQAKALQKCQMDVMGDPVLKEECTQAYLRRRAEFQQEYVEKGMKANVNRKWSEI